MIEHRLRARQLIDRDCSQDVQVSVSKSFKCCGVVALHLHAQEVSFTQHTYPIPFELEVLKDRAKHYPTIGHPSGGHAFGLGHLLKKKTKTTAATSL